MHQIEGENQPDSNKSDELLYKQAYWGATLGFSNLSFKPILPSSFWLLWIPIWFGMKYDFWYMLAPLASHVHHFYFTFVWSLLALESITGSCYCQGARKHEGKEVDIFLVLCVWFPIELIRCLCGTGKGRLVCASHRLNRCELVSVQHHFLRNVSPFLCTHSSLPGRGDKTIPWRPDLREFVHNTFWFSQNWKVKN